MIDSNKAFRDYATRVSFNMSLSRNQIYALRCVMLDIEMQDRTFDERSTAHYALRRGENGITFSDHYVSGIRKLLEIGIVENDPRWIEDEKQCEEDRKKTGRAIKKYWGPSCRITPAGELVIELLRIAGLIAPAAANDASFTKKKARK